MEKSCKNCENRLCYLKTWEEKIYDVKNYLCKLDKSDHEPNYCCEKYVQDKDDI